MGPTNLSNKKLFTPMNIARMMSEGDSESQYRVRFSDFFSLLCFTKYEKSMSIDKYLINWLSYL